MLLKVIADLFMFSKLSYSYNKCTKFISTYLFVVTVQHCEEIETYKRENF